MRGFLRRHSPFLLVTTALLATLYGVLLADLDANDGHLIYALDDTYIHMAIARNFAEHGVFGVTPHGFTSNTSSPLWTLLLAAVYAVFGPNEWAPLALNVLFAVATLAVVSQWFHENARFRDRSPPGDTASGLVLVTATLLAVSFYTPMVSLVFCGMEHTLHVLLTILLAQRLWRLLTSESPLTHTPTDLLVVAALLTVSRYEGLFMIAMVSIVLWVGKRRRPAVYVTLAGVLPVAIYGAVSMAKGWGPLPNSVYLKGAMPRFDSVYAVQESLGMRSVEMLRHTAHLLVLVVAAVAALLWANLDRVIGCGQSLWHRGSRAFCRARFTRLLAPAASETRPTSAMAQPPVECGSTVASAPTTNRGLTPVAIVFLGATMLHLQFAGTGWFYRYESYLVAFGVVVVGLFIHRGSTRQLWCGLVAFVGLGALFGFPMANRGMDAMRIAARATHNVYEQQFQTAKFLAKYYPNRSVAVNDIGMVSYFSTIDLLDVWGLATMEVAWAKRAKTYDRQTLDRLTLEHGTQFAVVYNTWIKHVMPERWTEVARWRIKERIVSGGDTMSFHVIDPAARDELLANLREFTSELPADVGYWITGDPPMVYHMPENAIPKSEAVVKR
jgi:hypothetical protein